MYPNLIKENRRMWTWNRLDLQTLGSRPFMPRNLPDHWSVSPLWQPWGLQNSSKCLLALTCHSQIAETESIMWEDVAGRNPGYQWPTLMCEYKRVQCNGKQCCLYSWGKLMCAKTMSRLLGNNIECQGLSQTPLWLNPTPCLYMTDKGPGDSSRV